MKNIKYFPLMGLLIIIIVFLGLGYAGPTADDEVNVSGLQRPYGPKRARCQTASTSPTYTTIADTASSTCILDVSTVDSGNLNVITTASTTRSEFQFSIYSTFDSIDWYPFKGFTETNNNLITYGSSSQKISIKPADPDASSTFHTIPIKDIRGKFMRINYGAVASSGAFYIELIK